MRTVRVHILCLCIFVLTFLLLWLVLSYSSCLKVSQCAHLLCVLCCVAALCGACEPDLLLCCNRRLCVGACKPLGLSGVLGTQKIFWCIGSLGVFLDVYAFSRHPVVPVEFPSRPESSNVFIRQASGFCSVCSTVLIPLTFICAATFRFTLSNCTNADTLHSLDFLSIRLAIKFLFM